MKVRRLVIDLETSPHVIDAWEGYETNALRYHKYSQIIAVGWSWVGEKAVYCMALPDFPEYKVGRETDLHIVKFIRDLLDKADVVIYQNGDKFDRKVIQARLWYHHLTPPSPYKTVDTLKISRRNFRLPSHKLDEKAKYGQYGAKVKTGGFDLWIGCMEGNMNAWRRMKRYCRGDVALTRTEYNSLLPWIDNHPNLNVYEGTRMNCPNCGSSRMVINKHVATSRTGKYTQFKCQECGHYATGPHVRSGVILR
jgi:predicted RNA-binding Zn-ribbon protein involved in translation (DUF1610 family)